MKLEFSDQEPFGKRFLTKFLLMVGLGAAVIYLVTNPEIVLLWGGKIVSLLSPFWMGLAFAFVMDIPASFLERRFFCGDAHPKKRSFWEAHGRKVAVLTVVLAVLLGIAVALFAVLPQVAQSIQRLSRNLPTYVVNTQSWLIGVAEQLPLGEGIRTDLMRMIQEVDVAGTLKVVLNTASSWLGSVVDITIGITSGTLSIFVSFVLSIYLLAGKKKLLLNAKRVMYAIFPQKFCRRTLRTFDKANQCFTGFVSGQCTEALILGTLCGIGMMILQLPYALVISLLVAIAAIIPFFGGMISAALGSLLLLFVNPTSALVFFIFIVVLQQIEGNFIYPRVVGSSVGLPGMWVLLAVFCGGSAFGFLGIVLGVPTCSLLYALLKGWTTKRLKKQGIGEKALADGQLDKPEMPIKTELQQADG